MLKAGDLARREDRRVRGVKIGKTRRDRGISHVCQYIMSSLQLWLSFSIDELALIYLIDHTSFLCSNIMIFRIEFSFLYCKSSMDPVPF